MTLTDGFEIVLGALAAIVLLCYCVAAMAILGG